MLLIQTKIEHCCYAAHLLNTEERTAFCDIVIAVKCIRTANARRIVRGLENSASASLLIYSNYALQECSLLTLIGTVLYNAIKEYYDDRTRKIIYFHGYTIEDNYNAIREKTGHSNKKDIEADEREDEFAMLAEKYTIDNCIVYALALTKDE
ncbi:hypothetical protein HBI37_096160 [Parastagonospora nodorum]|nr:hypothetical protein HBI37_096160 [Parastagonospora nodorum]